MSTWFTASPEHVVLGIVWFAAWFWAVERLSQHITEGRWFLDNPNEKENA